jgi:hypothetical protein
MKNKTFEQALLLDAIHQLYRLKLLKRGLTDEQHSGYVLGVETAIHSMEHCLGLSDHPESECNFLENLESDGV